MAQQLGDGDLPGIGEVGKIFTELIVEREFFFIDELVDHHGGKYLCDGADAVGGGRCLVFAEGALVEDFVVLCDRDAAEGEVFGRQAIEQAVEFCVIDGLAKIDEGNSTDYGYGQQPFHADAVLAKGTK